MSTATRKAKIISIDAIDRLQQRPAAEAIAELRECLTDLYPCFENLAKAYPGITAMGAIAGGEAHGIMAFASSIKGDCRSPGAKQAVRMWALILANLNPDLREIFEQEWVKERAIRLKADLRQARKASPE